MPLSDKEIGETITERVVKILRSNGLVCFTKEDMLDKEWEGVKKGEG